MEAMVAVCAERDQILRKLVSHSLVRAVMRLEGPLRIAERTAAAVAAP
jgi:hypothetical protein